MRSNTAANALLLELPKTQLNSFVNYYWQGGFKEDSFLTQRVAYNENKILAYFDLSGHLPRSTDAGAFHMTGLNAVVLSTQLAMIHGLLLCHRKVGEALVIHRSFTVEMKRKIDRAEGICVSMVIESVKDFEQTTNAALSRKTFDFTWRYEIENGAFTGTHKVRFVLP